MYFLYIFSPYANTSRVFPDPVISIMIIADKMTCYFKVLLPSNDKYKYHLVVYYCQNISSFSFPYSRLSMYFPIFRVLPLFIYVHLLLCKYEDKG